VGVTGTWEAARITVVFADARFEIRGDDRSTWTAAVGHGQRHGIPDEQLDLLTD
jgi:hypothetical protein